MVSSPSVPSWSTRTFVLARGTCTFLTFGLEGGVVDTAPALADEVVLLLRNSPLSLLLPLRCCGFPSVKICFINFYMTSNATFLLAAPLEDC